MMRTSITLPTPLHQRLILTAKAENKNMVQMIRELVEKGLVEKEKDQATRSYEALDKLIGLCKDDVPDTSTTINETLYGKNGAWKRDRES